MKKTLITVMIVIILILVLLIGGALGFLWYRDNHVYVEGIAYYTGSETLDLREEEISFGHFEALQQALPGCDITWNVPFQGGKQSSDSQSISVKTLTEEDVAILLEYFPSLKTLDASQCQDYLPLELLKAQKPDCDVRYQVSLGGKNFDPGTKELTLEEGDYDFVTMMANLIHLPDVEAIHMKMPELTVEQISELRAAYEQIDISCTVEILGQEYDSRTTELDLRALTSENVEEVAGKLSMLPNVTRVELTNEDGTSTLPKEDVRLLKEAAPQASFHYTFDFYGETLSTTDTEVYIRAKKIGDDGIDEVRTALSLMENCDRFVLEYCQISYDLLAQVREEFRDRTKLVWRVEFGGGSTFTDAEIIRSTYDLVDDNCHNLIYCEDVRYMDIGHNEYLDAVPFVAGMPNLEVIIVSGAPIKDLTPFENCRKLRVLEIAFCEYLTDISPLAGCEALEMVNIGNTHIVDLSPLDGMNLTHVMARVYPGGVCRIPLEEQQRFAAANPGTQVFFTGAQPYGDGWRYDDQGDELPWYAEIREVFRYNRDPHIPNNVGWYLPEDFVPVPPAKTLSAVQTVEETVPETMAAEETAPAETTN